MDALLIVPIALPVLAGLVCLGIRNLRIRAIIAFTALIAALVVCGFLFFTEDLRFRISWISLSIFNVEFDLMLDPLSRFVALGCTFFGLILLSYTIKQLRFHKSLRIVTSCFLLMVGMANGAILANNLFVMLIFWGMVPVLLYILIRVNGPEARKAAVKSLMIVGGTDFLLLFGTVLLGMQAGSLEFGAIHISTRGTLPVVAFILFLCSALGKAGSVPFQSWIPDASDVTPQAFMAFIPAALDKLLGIYLLARMVLNLFILDPGMRVLMMSIGAVTIIGPGMMILIQQDWNRLMAFSTISQVGYMVIGMGTGSLVGLAGGLFHMLNNAIYKSNLFLCSGAVEYRTGTTNFSGLGGLSSTMPVTFISCLIASLSISGVPPLNGFVSKWLIYQGIIEADTALWPVFLVAAMFGSAFTMAGFIKVLHSVFLGVGSGVPSGSRDIGWAMKFPMVLLTVLCIFCGVFAVIPLKTLIGPVLGMRFGELGESIQIKGMWSPAPATLLLIVSLLCGWLITLVGRGRSVKIADPFIGGEVLDDEEVAIPGTHFYDSIASLRFLSVMVEWGKRGIFDLYEIGRRVSTTAVRGIHRTLNLSIEHLVLDLGSGFRSTSRILRKIQTGVLSDYIIYFLAGIVLLIIFLLLI